LALRVGEGPHAAIDDVPGDQTRPEVVEVGLHFALLPRAVPGLRVRPPDLVLLEQIALAAGHAPKGDLAIPLLDVDRFLRQRRSGLGQVVEQAARLAHGHQNSVISPVTRTVTVPRCTSSTAIVNGKVLTRPWKLTPDTGLVGIRISNGAGVRRLRSSLSRSCPGSPGTMMTSKVIEPSSFSPSRNSFATELRSVTSISAAVPLRRSRIAVTPAICSRVSGDPVPEPTWMVVPW